MRGRWSPHTDGDFVAQAAEVSQAHRDGEPWGTARYPDIHLIQTGVSWGFAKKQNLSHPVSDRDLWSNSTPVNEACEINLQCFSNNGGVARRGELRSPCVQDRALS